MTDAEITSFFESKFGVSPRPQQLEIIKKILSSDIDTSSATNAGVGAGSSIIVNAGTGIGKSLIAVAACLIKGRGIIVAPNRPLQWQYLQEPYLKGLFDSGELSVLMGKSNYPCRARGCYYCCHDGKDSCAGGEGCNLFLEDDEAPDKIITCGDVDFDEDCKFCKHHPKRCDVFHDMCYYFAAREKAKNARVVIVNTAILFYAQYLLPVPYDIVVYDEAHQLEDFYRMLFSQGIIIPKNLHYINKNLKLYMEELQYKGGKVVLVEEYFRKAYKKLHDKIIEKRSISGKGPLVLPPEAFRRIVEDYKKLLQKAVDVGDESESKLDMQQNIAQVDDIIKNFDTFSFNIEVGKRSTSLQCEPVYVDFIHKKHLDIAPTHLLMSATVFEGYTDIVLGIQGSTYFEVDNNFLPANCPIFIVKNEDGKRDNRERFLKFFCESLTRLAPKLKGRTLIHTISRDNQQKIMQQLPLSVANRVIEVRSVQEYLHKLNEYKAKDDAILMSYSLKEGIDLKGDLCTCVIILHASMPNPSSPIVKAYLKIGLPVFDYTIASSLAQAAGRAVRSINDKATVLVYDNRFIKKNSILKWLPPQWRRSFKLRKLVNG